MTILNMTGGGASGPKIPLNDITTLSATDGENSDIVLKWTDVGNLVVNGVTANSWTATKLVRKVGSAPSSSSDGTLVTTSTTLNQYQTNGYDDTGLTDGTTYYYKAFSVGSNGLESGSNSVSAVPSSGWKPGANTIAYYKFNNNLNDSSENGKNLSIYSGSPIYGTETGGGMYIYFPNDCWTTYWEDSISYNNTTLSFFWKGTSSSRSGKPIIEAWANGYDVYSRVSGNITFEYRVSPNVSYSAGTGWHYYTLVTDSNNKCKIYIDGQYYGGNTTGTGSGTHTIRFRFNQYGNTNTASNCNTGYLGEVIFENKEWTADEVSDYYNQTKSLYGIS